MRAREEERGGDEPEAMRMRTAGIDEEGAQTFFLQCTDNNPGGEIEVCFAEDVFNVLKKKGRKELNEKEVQLQFPERFVKEKVAEWQKLLAHGAICLLSAQETREVRQTKPERVIGSRYVNTIEPDHEAEDGMKVKSRFCLLGHQHPDVLDIARKNLTASPTATQAGKTTVLQLIASFRWRLEIGDVEAAFLTTDKWDKTAPDLLKRGGLYCELPRGGIP